MCLVCDGYSHESAMQAIELAIRVHGWALVQVEGDDASWCYTVGLLANYGHPELTLVDVGTEHQREIIEPLVEGVQRSGRLPLNRLGFFKLRAVTVHDDHLDGELFGTWANLYGHFPGPGEMLQIVLPAEAYCSCHAPAVRRLDLAGPLPLPPGPFPMNRAERRRRRARRT